MGNLSIKDIEFSRIGEAFKLVEDVFMEFDAPDYSEEGVNEFMEKIINNNEFINKFQTGEQTMIGAFDNDKIVGVLAISDRNHISLVFVDKRYHRMGIASRLFNEIIKKVKLKGDKVVKLNSSPYAVVFYEKLNFISTDMEQETKGIRYTPMELTI